MSLNKQQLSDLLMYGACCNDPELSYAEEVLMAHSTPHKTIDDLRELMIDNMTAAPIQRFEDSIDYQCGKIFDAHKMFDAVDDIPKKTRAEVIKEMHDTTGACARRLKAKQLRKRKGHK